MTAGTPTAHRGRRRAGDRARPGPGGALRPGGRAGGQHAGPGRL